MKNQYYTLLIQNPDTNVWAVEFGDFDRETVEEERDITWREGEGYKLYNTKIIKTGEDQKEINAKVDELNKPYQETVESWENKNFAEYLKTKGYGQTEISNIANGWFKVKEGWGEEKPTKKYSVCVEVVSREFYEVDAVDEDDAIANWQDGKHYHTNPVCDEPVSATIKENN